MSSGKGRDKGLRKSTFCKIRLKRLGSLKAIKNISEKILAPKTDAVSISLIKPRTREAKIPKVLVNIDLNIGNFYPWSLF